MGISSVAVIIPVYKNAATVVELHRRVREAVATTGARCRMVFVDDACPAGSLPVLEAIARDDADCSVIAMARNVGQNRAVLTGLASIESDAYVVMDADLQDPPETLRALLVALAHSELVFAARRGVYSSTIRRLEAWLYRGLLYATIGLPRDAGIFSAFSRRVRDRVLGYDLARPNVVVLLGGSGVPSTRTPFRRELRPEGSSAYNHRMRLRVAADALGLALRFRLGLVAREPFRSPAISRRIGFHP